MKKKSNTSTRLNEIMIEQNLKQVDILKKSKPYCKKFNVKLERNDLSQYVSGKIEPGQKKLMVLAETLNVSPAWLMGLDVPKAPRENIILPEGETDLQFLERILKSKGFLNEDEKLSEENFNMLIDFAKANKQFIMKDKDNQ